MIRPAPRGLACAGATLAASALAVGLGGSAAPAAAALWLALTAAMAADLILSRPRRREPIEAAAPGEIFTGESAALHLRVAHARGPVDVRVDWPEGLDGPETARLAPDGDGDGAAGALDVTARKRGVWRIERIWLRAPSRLGLFELTPKLATDLAITATPNIRPVSSGIIDASVRSAVMGVKANEARGEGAEFHQLRDFATGMDVRAIDWKHSARHQTLLAKETRAERNHHVILAVDNGRLMREEIGGLARIDHAVNAALATAWAAGLGGDLVGLYAYDSRPRLFEPPSPGRRAFPRLRRRAAELTYSSVETNHALGLAELSARTPRRSLIVVFSDFDDVTTAELFVENVAGLARRHRIVFAALRDSGLDALARRAPRDLDEAARALAAGRMLRERRVVMERLARLGVAVIDAPPEALTPRLVSAYLDLKSRAAA